VTSWRRTFEGVMKIERGRNKAGRWSGWQGEQAFSSAGDPSSGWDGRTASRQLHYVMGCESRYSHNPGNDSTRPRDVKTGRKRGIIVCEDSHNSVCCELVCWGAGLRGEEDSTEVDCYQGCCWFGLITVRTTRGGSCSGSRTMEGEGSGSGRRWL